MLVKRTFISEQLECYVDEQAAIATVKKEKEQCLAKANKAYEVQLALQNRWKAQVAKAQELSLKKAKLQREVADLEKHLFPVPPQ